LIKTMFFLPYILTLILIALTLLICSLNNLNLDKRISYFFLSFFFFGVYSYQPMLGIITIPFITLLFIPYLKLNKKEMVNSLAKKRFKVAMLGFISVLLISLLYANPFLEEFIYKGVFRALLECRQIQDAILVFSMIYSLFLLKFKYLSEKENLKFRFFNNLRWFSHKNKEA
ncbi:MAG: hypothetical protein ACFFAO_13875, partial [Candidatus Hermodarchaeota archaeon]